MSGDAPKRKRKSGDAPHGLGVKPINVFDGRNHINDGGVIQVRRHRQLQQNSIHFGCCAELPHYPLSLLERRAFWKMLQNIRNANLLHRPVPSPRNADACDSEPRDRHMTSISPLRINLHCIALEKPYIFCASHTPHVLRKHALLLWTRC